MIYAGLCGIMNDKIAACWLRHILRQLLHGDAGPLSFTRSKSSVPKKRIHVFGGKSSYSHIP